MSNIIPSLRTFGIIFIIMLAIQNTCYAKFVTKVREVDLQCAPNEEEADPMSLVFPGDRNAYLSIATKGIRIAGKMSL